VTSKQKKKPIFRLFLGVLFCLVSLHPALAFSITGPEPLITNGGYAVQKGSSSWQYREHDLFIPASTLKILTSLAALNILGEDYRFKTSFFLDHRNNLYIKGFGDPFLTSEVVLDICHALKKKGINTLSAIYLDTSSFNLNNITAGDGNSTNPYDAPNGALAVNFNSLPINVSKNGSISSGEPQTPTIPLMHEIGKQLSPGHHRVNIDGFATTQEISPTIRYTGELFMALLKMVHIEVEGSYLEKKTPTDLQPFFIHHNDKSLKEIVRACLKYSNNFIANQLFLVCGAKSSSFPATWEKSRLTFSVYIKESLGLSAESINVVEGSGLSKENRVTPAALLIVLKSFKPYAHLLNRTHDILVKSGTLQNVFCYAGYFQIGKTLAPYVLLLNQPENIRDQLLQRLYKLTLLP